MAETLIPVEVRFAFASVLGGDGVDYVPARGYQVAPGLAVARAPKRTGWRCWQVVHIPSGVAMRGDFATRRAAIAGTRVLMESGVRFERMTCHPSRQTRRKVSAVWRRFKSLTMEDESCCV